MRGAGYVYSTDAGQVAAIRFDDRWKAMYLIQDAEGTEVWLRKLRPLKAPMIFDLRMDPYEKATTSNNYWTLWSQRVFQISQAGRYVAEFAQTFEEYPPRQRPATWGIEQLMEQYLPE